MIDVAYLVLAASFLLALYAYLGYPLLVRLLGRARPEPQREEPEEWPRVSFSLPAYNEEAEIAGTLERLLAIDYPPARRQIVVVSDASTDRTDEIVGSFADRGVELIRQPERRGKTAAEALAADHVDGEIVINTDASIRIAPDAVRPLVARFRDPRVGVASGRDVSVSRLDAEQNVGEAGYVGYEMAVRDAETRLYGIVGASGSFYGIRARLHRVPLPEELSRDFAAALHAEENGFRAVSVPEAVAYVPRAASLQAEYRRKVRTMQRGMRTLWFKRHLLNPFRHPVFAWMLWSHKVARWALPWAALVALAALGVIATGHAWARVVLILGGAGLLSGLASWRAVASGKKVPGPLYALAYAVMGNIAAMHAALKVVTGGQAAVWEPTRRRGGGGR